MAQNGVDTQMTLVDQRKLNTVLLAFMALVGVVFVLYELYEVLLPLVLATLLSLIFKPVVVFLRRHGVPLSLCILIVLLIVAAIFALIGFIAATGIQNMIAEGPQYQQRINHLYQSAMSFVTKVMHRFGRGGGAPTIADTFQLSSITGFVASSAGSFLTLLVNLVLTLLFLIFLLLGSEDFPSKIYRAFSTEQSARMSQVIAQIHTDVRRYMVTKTLINVIVATVTVVVLLIFGVDFALLAGVLTFFMNYIPNFGAVIATVFPAAVCLLQFDTFGTTIIVVVLLVTVHNIIGNFVEPKMMGSSLNLSPLVVLLALIFWGWVWGVWGMVLAVPITSIVKIVCENVPPLHPIAVMISSPPEKAKAAE